MTETPETTETGPTFTSDAAGLREAASQIERIWNLETEIVARLAPQVEAAIAAEKPKPTATRRIYSAGQRRFIEFCSERGVPHMPASPGALAGFLLAELDRGASWAVIQQRICAIKRLHHDADRLPPMRDRLVQVTLAYVKEQLERKGEKHGD
jgi:hypothetical protein